MPANHKEQTEQAVLHPQGSYPIPRSSEAAVHAVAQTDLGNGVPSEGRPWIVQKRPERGNLYSLEVGEWFPGAGEVLG